MVVQIMIESGFYYPKAVDDKAEASGHFIEKTGVVEHIYSVGSITIKEHPVLDGKTGAMLNALGMSRLDFYLHQIQDPEILSKIKAGDPITLQANENGAANEIYIHGLRLDKPGSFIAYSGPKSG